MEDQIPILELPNGIKISGKTRLCTDWAGMRSLYESGLPISDIAGHYKLTTQAVRAQAQMECWVSPTKVNKLRRDIEAKQRAIWKKSGKTTEVAAVKAAIWDERADIVKERTYEIVKEALDGVTSDQAKKMIRNPKGLLEMVTVAQKITGEETKTTDTSKIAVNINLLRSQRVIDAPTLEAEVVPSP